MQTGLSDTLARFSGVFSKFKIAANLFTSDILKTWFSACVQPAESPIDSPQHRYFLTRFALGSLGERSWKYGLPKWYVHFPPEVKAPSSSLRPGKTWKRVLQRSQTSHPLAISIPCLADSISCSLGISVT